MREVQTIGEGIVWRTSDNKDKNGNYFPPWKEIKITNIFEFRSKPVVGDKVTVIPLEVDIRVFDLEIKETKLEDTCGQPSDWWSVELEPLDQINHKRIFEVSPAHGRAAEYPFDVAVIYPAVRFAKQIKRNRLTKRMLPKGLALKTIKAAIDLTSDGQPDILIAKYCCNNPQKPEAECDLTCGTTYKKVKNTWKIVDTSSPY